MPEFLTVVLTTILVGSILATIETLRIARSGMYYRDGTPKF